jgi:alpha-beta hydrolase superfamily lysophospholipase
MPTRPRSPAPMAALAAVLACPASPALGIEPARMEQLWIDTVAPDGTPSHTVPALLNVPPVWMPGDAAVVVLSDGPWPGPARERLVAALLGEGAAVLELDAATARGFSPENAVVGAPATAEELLPDLRGAVDALRRDAGAGLVVALGQGAGGEAAVLAAERERSAPAEWTGAIAAAAFLGPGPARFALGGATPGRGWPVRAALLCEVLAIQAVPSQPDAEAECRHALSGQGDAYAARTGRR